MEVVWNSEEYADDDSVVSAGSQAGTPEQAKPLDDTPSRTNEQDDTGADQYTHLADDDQYSDASVAQDASLVNQVQALRELIGDNDDDEASTSYSQGGVDEHSLVSLPELGAPGENVDPQLEQLYLQMQLQQTDNTNEEMPLVGIHMDVATEVVTALEEGEQQKSSPTNSDGTPVDAGTTPDDQVFTPVGGELKPVTVDTNPVATEPRNNTNRYAALSEPGDDDLEEIPLSTIPVEVGMHRRRRQTHISPPLTRGQKKQKHDKPLDTPDEIASDKAKNSDVKTKRQAKNRRRRQNKKERKRSICNALSPSTCFSKDASDGSSSGSSSRHTDPPAESSQDFR
jgi:hypothetical protein